MLRGKYGISKANFIYKLEFKDVKNGIFDYFSNTIINNFIKPY